MRMCSSRTRSYEEGHVLRELREWGEERRRSSWALLCNRVLNSLGLVWAQEFEGFWVFGWGRQNGTKKLLSKCCQVLSPVCFLFGGLGGAGIPGIPSL